MKKSKFNGRKLVLRGETIRTLTFKDFADVAGGAPPRSDQGVCVSAFCKTEDTKHIAGTCG